MVTLEQIMATFYSYKVLEKFIFFHWNRPELNVISLKQWGISLVRTNLLIRRTSLRLPELNVIFFLIINEEKNFLTTEAIPIS